jgi:hypothetical protein
MMLTYFLFALYAPGDENIIIDSSQALVTTPVKELKINQRSVTLYPNPSPASSKAEIYFNTDANDKVKVSVYDLKADYYINPKPHFLFPVHNPGRFNQTYSMQASIWSK